jgi:uncharacterized phage-associated protein
MYNNEPLFDGTFYGWKYGPVLKEVRSSYMTGVYFSEVQGSVSEKTKELLKSVLERYGSLTSWKLSSLSHEEFSWKKARTGLEADDDGDVELSLDAMRVDATRELMNRKVQQRKKEEMLLTL